MKKQASERQLKEFKRMLNKVTRGDINFLTEDTIKDIFENNFESNLNLASKVMFHKYDEINSPEFPITNMDRAVDLFNAAREKDEKILLITDNDSDGSQAQAAMLAAKNISTYFNDVNIEYAQNVNKKKSAHGITVEVVEEWFKKHGYDFNEKITIMTADNGIQSRPEIESIMEKFPNSKIILTDHHLPDDEMTPKESRRLTIVNPKYKSIGFFKENKDINISGANVLSWFIKNVIRKNDPNFDESKFEVLDNVEKHSNSMDFVKSVISKYPIKNHEIEENTNIRALMNINNSVKSFIGRDIPDSQLDKMADLSKEFKKENIKDSVSKIKVLNNYSKILLSMMKEYEKTSDSEKSVIDSDIFYSHLAQKITDMDVDNIEDFSINNNYIEQLRPYVFLALSDPNKDNFMANMYEKMVGVFSDLKKCENLIVKELIKVDLMHVIKTDNVTVMYPKDMDLLNGFGRKLLMKAYNEVNNGLFFVFSNNSPENKEGNYKVEGSFRSTTIASDDFINSANKYFKDFNIKLKGHDFAAGAFFMSEKPITIKKIEKFSEFAEGQVKEYRESKIDEGSKYDAKDYYLFDTTNLHIAKDINNVIKGALPNQKSIKPLFKLTRSSRFKDKSSGKAITVGEMLKKEKYGYAIIELNFAGDAAIIGTEVVRKLSENNFKDYVEFQQIDDSAFIANAVVRQQDVNPENIIKVHSEAKKSEEKLMEEYLELEKNNYVKKLSREDLKEMDLFKRNTKHGEKEFNLTEELIISMIDKMELDQYTVLDVEANGLGRPELFNVGTLDLKIKDGSGIKIPLGEYTDAKRSGKIKELIDKKYLDGKGIRNVKLIGDEIIINRELDGEMFAMLGRSPDFSILEPIADLVGFSQSSMNKYGRLVAELDKEMYKRYKDTKTAIVIHNAPYDASVLRANSPLMAKYMEEEAIVCDSAPIAKSEALGYADMEVTRIGNIKEALFFNNKISDFSLSKVVEGEEDFVYPDIRGDFVLKRKDKSYYLIDKRNNIETRLPYSDEKMREGSLFEDVPMPRNRVKYGIQFLLKNLSIRNMLLEQINEKVELLEAPEYLNKIGVGEIFKEISEKYNFGGSFTKNLYNYLYSLKQEDEKIYKSTISKLFDDELAAEKYFSMTREDITKYNLKVDKAKDKKEKTLIKAFEKENKNLNQDDLEVKEVKLKKKIEQEKEKLESEKIEFNVLEKLEEGVSEFLEKNKETYLKYINNWEYQALLEVHDPKKKVLAKDDLEKIAYQTALPEERIKKMCSEIYEYKKSQGIEKESFYIPELHNNFNEKGDMVIEHFAVLSSLMVQHYNRYSNTMSDSALNILNDSYSESHTRYIKNRSFHDYELQLNSASVKQLRGYKNRQDEDGKVHVSDEVLRAKNINEIIIKNKYTQESMSIKAEASAMDVSLEDIEDLEKDVNFVISYNLLLNSRPNIIGLSGHLDQYIENIKAEEMGDLFYKMSLYKAKDKKEVSDSINSMDLSENQKESILSIYNFSSKMVDLNKSNSEVIEKYLNENKEEFLDSYKRVYDKIGYFYVSKSKEEVKKIVDSIYANAIANTEKTNVSSAKTVTEEMKEEIRVAARKIFKLIEKDLKMDIQDKVKIDIVEKISKMPTINEYLSEMIMRSSEIRKEMDHKDFKISEMAHILPLSILETKKNNPIKELSKYPEMLHSYINKKINKSLEDKEDLVFKNKSKPKNK